MSADPAPLPRPQANPPYLDKVEDLVNLVHLNEASALHVLRQRYASSLIHTFAGRHLIVINPLRPLSSYVDRVSALPRPLPCPLPRLQLALPPSPPLFPGDRDVPRLSS